MDLKNYSSQNFFRGATRVKEVLWVGLAHPLFSSWIPGSTWRAILLQLFGANIGCGAVIKPHVRVKFPWRLKIGSHCWIGEDVWIDNLDIVSLGDNVCLSQGSYFCTGSHNWNSASFELITKPISIGSHVWVAAKSIIAPGTVIEDGVVVTIGSVCSGHLKEWTIYSGTFARSARVKPEV